MNNAIRLVGPLHALGGYPSAARALLRTLIVAGYEVQAIESDLREQSVGWSEQLWDCVSVQQVHPKLKTQLLDDQETELRDALRRQVPAGSPTLAIQIPEGLRHWQRYTEGPLIGYTMTEADNLSPDWAHGCRAVDAVVVPSTFCREVFQRVVPEAPCAVVPLAVDDRVWTTDGYVEGDLPAKRPPFLFLAVASPNPRKQLEKLMQAFAEEFREEPERVGLIVKPSGNYGLLHDLADWCRAMGAWVYVDTEKRNDYTLAALYRACNVYVQPSSEGFGLPYVEAALCGLPSVALDKGGAVDVVSEDTGYVCPSSWQPIIGHMPHRYPRKDHRFAIPDIDDLRATLRRAYEEEKAGAEKGFVARTRALQRFTPEAVAPKLRQAIEWGVSIHADNVVAARHPVKPEWATVAGAWGDVMVTIGDIRAMMADKEMESIGLIWYGRDPNIADFLRAQPWVREVVALVEPDPKEMTRTYGHLCQALPAHGRAMFRRLLRDAGIAIQGEIAYTQLCLAQDREPTFWRGAVLPQGSKAWAEDAVGGLGTFLLLNPLSIASNKARDHWRHWPQAMAWLLGVVNVPVVLVCEQEIPYPDHPRLVNLSGKTRSMADVLALCERSAGVITTGNNLGIYAAIAGTPAVVVAARTLAKGNIYHQWYNRHCSWVGEDGALARSFVEVDEPLSDFQAAVMTRFPRFVGDVEKAFDIVTEAQYYAGQQGLGRA